MRSLIKSLVPQKVWRSARNLIARFRLLAHTSGTCDAVDYARAADDAKVDFRDYCELASLTPQLLAGLDVLEIGPGNNLLVAALFYAAGAKRVVCIDRFPSRPNLEQAKAASEALMLDLPHDQRQRFRSCMTDGLVSASRDLRDRLVYRSDCPIEEAPLRLGTERFDLVLSRSVLEHVYSLERAFASMATLTKRGGLMVHKVDLRSHEDGEQSHPLEFLTHSRRWWRWMTSHTGEPNRVRKSAYLRLLRESGFQVLRLERTHFLSLSEVEQIRPSLASPFRDLPDDDLTDTGIFFCARRL